MKESLSSALESSESGAPSRALSDSENNSDATDRNACLGQEEGDNIPFEQLERMRQHGGITKQQLWQIVERAKASTFKRDNKNRPMEVSSKRPVPRSREVVPGIKRDGRDPRFDSLSGTLDTNRFRKRYAFLYDEQLPAEREEIKQTLQKTKSADRKKELQGQLTRVQQQIREEQARRQKQVIDMERKKREKAAVKEGKKVFFPKRSDKKRQDLVRRYEELKVAGRLEKAMAKRRKKNALKDHRYMPSGRKTVD